MHRLIAAIKRSVASEFPILSSNKVVSNTFITRDVFTRADFTPRGLEERSGGERAVAFNDKVNPL